MTRPGATEERQPAGRSLWLFALLAVVVVAVLALWALGEAVSWELAGGIFAFGLIATIPRAGRTALQSLCAAVLGLLAVIGFNVATRIAVEWMPDSIVTPYDRLPIQLGLALAVVVFWGTAYFYLRGKWLDPFPKLRAWVRRRAWLRNPEEWSPAWSLLASGLLATLVLIALPPAVTLLRDRDLPEPGPLPAPTRIGADLDVRIIAVRPLPKAADIPPDPARAGFLPAFRRAVDLDVRFATGFADNNSVRWTRVGMTDEAETRTALTTPGQPAIARPERRAGADGIVVLMVDAVSPVVDDPAALEDVEGEPDEVERWRSIALDAGAPNLAAVALLQSSDAARLRRWQAFSDVGEVVSLQRFGSQTVTDAAVRLGIGTTTGADDYRLAMRHRPILLFDDEEPVPRPLSIEQLFKDGRVRQCEDLQSAGRCDGDPLTSPADLVSPGRHLVIDSPRGLQRLADRERDAWRTGSLTLPTASRPRARAPAAAPTQDGSALGAAPPGTPPPTLPPGAPSASTDDPLLGADSRMYVNAVSLSAGTRRLLYLDYWWYLADNPARAVKGAFCGAGMVILGITCFDHESDWEGVTIVLERKGHRAEPVAVHYAQHESIVRYGWEALRAHWDEDPGLEDALARLPDHADRPVVWIARGTHASYARPCAGACRQVVADLEERPHDGQLEWVGNDTAACLRVACLLPLPTAAGGRGPASWNDFAGPWGRRRCWERYYCDSATPPPAPGRQDRYRDPSRYDGIAQANDPDGGYIKGGH